MKHFFFALTLLFCLTSFSQIDRKIGAILIGNGTYASPNFKTLSQSDDGVRIMKQLFIDLNISSELVTEAIDNMTVSQMMAEIKSKRDFFKSQKVTDIIFYYTGHGAVMTESGESFFVPGNFREDSLQQLYSEYGGINDWVLDFLSRATKPGSIGFNPELTGSLRDFNLMQHTVPLSVVCNELKEFNLLVLSDACRDTLPDISKGSSLMTMISDDELSSWIKKQSSLNPAGRQKFVKEVKDFIAYINQKNTEFNRSVSSFKNTMSLLSVRKPVTVFYGTTYYNKAFENPDVIGGVFTAALEQAVRNSKNLILQFNSNLPAEVGKYITSSKGQIPYIEGAQNFELFNPFIKGQEITIANINKATLNSSFEAISLQKKVSEGNISSNFFSEDNLIRQQLTRKELADWPSFTNLIASDTTDMCKTITVSALGRVPAMSFIFEDDIVRTYHVQEATLLPAYKYRFSIDKCEMFLKDSSDLFFDNQQLKKIRQEFDGDAKYRVLNDFVISLLQDMKMPPLGTFSKLIVRRISPKYDTIYVELPDKQTNGSLLATLVKTKSNKKVFAVNNLPYKENGEITDSKKLRIRNIKSTATYAPNNTPVINKWQSGEYVATIKMSVDLDSTIYQVADSVMAKMFRDFMIIQAIDITGCKDARSPYASGKTCIKILGEAKYSVEKVIYEKQFSLSVNFKIVNPAPSLKIAIPFDYNYPKYVKNVYVESLTIDYNGEFSAEEAVLLQESSNNESGKMTAAEANLKGDELAKAKDYAGALRYYSISAEMGNAAGQYNLGYLYDSAEGIGQDFFEAHKWYRKSSEQGYPLAQLRLGFMYEWGKGVAKDLTEAKKWYTKAAEQNQLGSQLRLAYILKAEENYTEAAKWYRKAADQGSELGQDALGNIYTNGNGVTKDYKEAVFWYRKAAEQGYDIGQYNLGGMYEKGQGVNQDYSEAIKWYRKAAVQGQIGALISLGQFYMDGTGVNLDYGEAAIWYRKAADRGSVVGQYWMGNIYEKGKGVTKNIPEAVKWYRLAAEKGGTFAKERLKALGYNY